MSINQGELMSAGAPTSWTGSSTATLAAAVFDKYFRYQMIALNYRGDEPAPQHQALLECALARDAVRAKSVLVDHVTGCVAHALAAGTLAAKRSPKAA
jgi:DNA-binding GntR family transcriptional regulator